MNQEFISYFKLNADELTKLISSEQTKMSLVELCLEKKLITEASYLEWAKNHYGLAILKESFLEQHNQTEILLNRYKNVFPKSVVPFYEWDGVIYVMCLEPANFKAPQPLQCVLAPYNLLQKYAILNESKVQASKAESIIIPPPKETTNPLFKDLEVAASNTTTPPSFDFALPDNLAPNNNSATEIKAPEGIDLKQTSILNLGDLETKADVPFEAPASLEELTPELNTTTQAPEGLSFPTLAESKPEAAVDHKITSDDLKALPADAKETPTKIFTIPLPEATPTNTPSTASAPEVNTTAAQTLGDFQSTFDQLKKYFNQSMILSFNNNILTPYKYDTTWTKDSYMQSAIDTSSPSIFRIVCETQKPYHGYVIPNSINDTFFATWNQGKYPEHITLYPVVADKKLIGMILGTTTKENSKNFQLHHIEAIANDCQKLILKEFSSKAA